MTARTLLTSTSLQTYVALGGNDANDGLTPSTPKLTIQAMLDWLKGYVDHGNWRTYVNILDPGGYAGFCVFNHWVGGANVNSVESYLQAPVIIRPADIVSGVPVLSTALNRTIVGGINVSNAVLGMEWLDLNPGTGPCLKSSMSGHVFIGFMQFGACTHAQKYACTKGRISSANGCNIRGGGLYHNFAERRGGIEDYGVPGWTDAIVAPVNFSGGMHAANGGEVGINGKTYAGAANVTGPKGSVWLGGEIYTAGTFGSYPGDHGYGPVGTAYDGWIGVDANGVGNKASWVA